MHISESRQSSNTILTKCSKMTEEKHKRHGMNGNADGVIKDEPPKTSYVQGGRLKFFKDGKFILELERAREGERVSWVSVPRKTFWPPQGTAASTPSYRQESSASLSVSDDNSSIQSSPWQRDHSWKQPSPRRNQSKELVFFFWRPKHKRSFSKIRKSRRPYTEIVDEVGVVNERTSKDEVSNNNCKSRVRASLLVIVQNLSEKAAGGGAGRGDVVVSPRKRFLREMEKDKVQSEDGCQKRSRNKTPQVTAKIGSPVSANGVTEDVKPARNCSYSITSLLAEDRNVKRSPSSSPSHFNTVTQSQYCSPSSEDRWYSESVDRLRSIELSQADKRGYPPYPHPSYLPHYMYPYPLSPYYGPGVYGRGYVMPPVYQAPPMSITMRHDTPSCSWAADPPRDLERRDDNITDMPLNLSKHAG
ncbi:uncharacterized protein H isoform X1 [Tribolium castaneum]|nr:PREDICTED: uncharacterized protein LOC103313713 isoform X1 [Tribolium castaneum]|eukprot:XP_008195936.1 PREDICTED: uncharacterized protein LOC103313713 isoform X1 [Tribolium castaneum]